MTFSRSLTRARRWRTWVRICQEWGLALLPLCRASIEAAGSAPKAAQYRSARNYFFRAKREDCMVTGTLTLPTLPSGAASAA